jgi:biotin carboxyl carrier protein
MKMEIAVPAPASGTVVRVLCAAGKQVLPGQPLVVLETL